MIELNNIRKEYHTDGTGVTALNDINLTINDGEFVAVIGPSGSGKSTLMNILGCLDTPTSGHYLLDDKEVGYLSPNQQAEIRNKKLGFVFQSFNLLPRLNALENVELPLIYRGMRPSERRRLSMEALERVGLIDRAYHKPSQMSGGQQQRVAIARALVADPNIIMADEPTGNLDSHSGRQIMDMLTELNGDGKTVILVTHDMNLAHTARRIVRIKDGVIENDEKVVAV
ncbi:ABC transporter ATP-binding protein [Mahella australiensis]|uniref:ABC transporter related protein n=1 Tax=Mahella australiensis (strain DSM 15567 / CIP 107919 / 50-1 BON) TaxID=697281 RepID=F3ZYF2_MAHA5|nr:ABC transporter ATP-binding protein [Mahella australiensis]AEE96694.1 ABC transporter related protein [Mahella australiensis 50-1 BON]